MDIKHIREAAQKMEAAFRSAEAAKLAQEELSLLFPDETTRRREIGRALSDQARLARDLIDGAAELLRKAGEELHEKWAEGERAMRGEGEFRQAPTSPATRTAERAAAFQPRPILERAREQFESFEAPPPPPPRGSSRGSSDVLIAWVEEDRYGKREPYAAWWSTDASSDQIASAKKHIHTLLQDSEKIFGRTYIFPSGTSDAQGLARAQVMADLADREAPAPKPKRPRKSRRQASPKAKAKERGLVAITEFLQRVRENPPQHGWDGKRVTVSDEILPTPAGVRTERGFWDRRQPGDESKPPPVYVGLPVTRVVGPHMRAAIIVKVNATRTRIVVRDSDVEEKYSWRPSRAVYGPIGDSSTYLQLGKAVDYHDPGV